MTYRQRIYYTEEQKALMWDRWQVSVGEGGHAPADYEYSDPNTRCLRL
jgi:hypothetical protein